MAIGELLALIPPPSAPLDAEGDWAIPESEFGTAFPSDFRELIRWYGSGSFGLGFLYIANPLAWAGRRKIREDLWCLNELRIACEFALILHPERPGLLPWGSDSHGHIYCWWTCGEPDCWHVVQVAHEEEDKPYHVDASISSFLVRYARNEYPDLMGGRVFDASNFWFEKGIFGPSAPGEETGPKSTDL